MKILFEVTFHTDGDFGFTDLDKIFDKDNPFYKGVVKSYYYEKGEESYYFRLECEGDKYPCQWAARDLMEHIVMHFYTRVHYYTMKYVYDLIINLKDEYLFKGDCKASRYFGGNYEGTVAYLEIIQ